MSDYYIKAILLEGCPYSVSADELMKKQTISNKSTWITQNEKHKFVTDKISTYPQIYLTKLRGMGTTEGTLLLGGFDDLNQFFNTFKSVALSDNNINKFMNKYKWSKKATLRLIQLINSK